MEFLFMGTGPADAIPRPGHSDPLCMDAQRPRSRSRRLRSAGLLRKGDTAILFDAGPDIGYQLTTHRIQDIDAVFLTHAHLDAGGGLKILDRWAGERGKVLPVYTERATRKRYGKFDHLEYRFVRKGQRVRVGTVSARFFRVTHSKKAGFPTLGFRIGRFAYASDAASIPASAMQILDGVCTLVLDAAYWFGQKYRGHMTPDKTIGYGRKLGVRCLVLTQTGHTFPPHDEAEKVVMKYAEERAPGMETLIAYDGLRVIMK